jgi:hypothetical protein
MTHRGRIRWTVLPRFDRAMHAASVAGHNDKPNVLF